VICISKTISFLTHPPDFGLSNFFSHDTLLNSFCGSPIYAAPGKLIFPTLIPSFFVNFFPEIMAEKHYNGPAADVWSLGIVLYAMVVGQLPWKLDERGIICDVDDLIRARFTIPSSATISAECEDLIKRLLVADPHSRLRMEDVARHPWILKGFGYPVNFNGEVLFIFFSSFLFFPLSLFSLLVTYNCVLQGSVPSLKVPKTPTSTRKRATLAIMNSQDPSLSELGDPAKDRRGSSPDNFFTKVSSKKRKEKKK